MLFFTTLIMLIFLSSAAASAVTEGMTADSGGNITLHLNADTEYTYSQLCAHLKSVGVSVSSMTSYSLDAGVTTFRSNNQQVLFLNSGESYSFYAPYNTGASKQWLETARFTVKLYTVPELIYPDTSKKSLDEAVIGDKALVTAENIPYASSKTVIFGTEDGTDTYEASYNEEKKAYEAEITVPADGLIKITVHRLTLTFPDSVSVKDKYGNSLESGADAEEGDYTVTVSPVGENAYIDSVTVNGKPVTDGEYENGNYIFRLSALGSKTDSKSYEISPSCAYRVLALKDNPSVAFIPCNFSEASLERQIISATVDKEKSMPFGTCDEERLSAEIGELKKGENSVTIIWERDEKYPAVKVTNVKVNLASPKHISGEWVTVKAPSCSTEGTEKKVCTLCGETTEVQKIKATGEHKLVSAVTKPDCTRQGYTTHKCSVCGYSFTDSYTSPLGHSYSTDYTVDKKATYTQRGSKSKHCTRKGCTAKASVTAVKMLTLTKVTGVKAKSGETTVSVSWKKVKGAEKYTVELLNSKGKTVKSITTKSTSCTFKKLSKGTTYKVKVRAVAGKNKGNFSSSLTLSTAPAKSKIISLKAADKGTLTVKWKSVSGASGYEVQYSTSKKLKSAKTVSVKKGQTVKLTLKKLKSKKKYYVRVRAFRTVGGKKFYGAWSTVKNLKVK